MPKLPPALRLLLALALLYGTALGQQTRALNVQNLAPFPRQEWVSVVVPFREGEVPETPNLHVKEHVTVWQPFGGRWPDGSVRQAACMFRTSMDALASLRFELAEGPGPDVPEPRFGLGPRRIRVTATVDGVKHEGQLEPQELLEQNAARTTVVLRGRIGTTGLVAEATLETYSGQEHAWFGVGVFFSDPTTEAMQLKVERVAVETEGLGWFVRHARPLGVRHERTATGTNVILLENTHLADGQGIRRVGVLVPPLAAGNDEATTLRNDTLKAATICKPLGATSWVGTQAFGAFGYVPPPPPWMADPGAAFAAQHARFTQWTNKLKPDPFLEGPRGLAKPAHRAGEQKDFGAVALEPVAGTGIPSFLYEVEMSALQDACRPVHMFEADGRPVLAKDHPNWIVWSGRTHWHCEVSTDRLGKKCPGPKFDSHGWTGKDRQHWSSNYIGAYYQLTGEPQVLLELRNETQLYLSGQTTKKGLSTSGGGASRGAGRSMHAATWLWLATGDQDLWVRMRDRMHEVHTRVWAGAKLEDGQVRPWKIYEADPRRIADNKAPTWVPWEESLAVTGFAAYLALTRDDTPEVVEMVDGVALTLLRHGWRLGAQPRVGYAMRYENGRPLTNDELVNPRWTTWPNAGFNEWGMGAIQYALHVAKRRGDDRLVERARKILQAVATARRPTRDGWYDRYSMWDGLRMPPVR